MHARELVDVAAVVALNGPTLVCAPAPPAGAALNRYWSSSRARFDSWTRALRLGAIWSSEPYDHGFDCWIDLRATLDEVFASEMLTRLWTAVLVGCDRRAGANHAEPIARGVLATHVEARKRALALLVQSAGLGVKQSATVNRLRRRVDHWSDILLGGLSHACDATEFAVDRQRACQFARSLTQRRYQPGGAWAWRATLSAMRGAFETGLSVVAANPQANARVAASILGCFPGHVFDSIGVPQSPWMVRLAAAAADTRATRGQPIGPPPAGPLADPGRSSWGR
jgi:hypothetical protein